MESLSRIYDLIKRISSVSSRKEKESIIKDVINSNDKTLFEKIVIYAYDHFRKYNVTNIQFDDKSASKSLTDIFEYLDYLSCKNGCTDDERSELGRVSSIDEKTCELINMVINKDLRCGVNIKTWLKYIPNIPVHDVMLCIDDVDKFVSICKTGDNCLWSLKKDGVRCWVVVNKEKIEYLSRNGKMFDNFKVFDENIRILAEDLHNTSNIQYPIIFDGEVTSKDENFQYQMTQLRKLKNSDCSIFMFQIFDIVLDSHSQCRRYTYLDDLFKKYNFDNVTIVEHKVWCEDNKPFTTEYIKMFAENICNQGHEGIVLKVRTGLYERKRSNLWCKVKIMKTIDLPVIRIELGKKGKKHENVLGALICYNKEFDMEIRVGSGYSDEQRIEFLTDTPKMIEIKYQEITKDGSLRFPVFVRVREDK